MSKAMSSGQRLSVPGEPEASSAITLFDARWAASTTSLTGDEGPISLLFWLLLEIVAYLGGKDLWRPGND